MVGFGSAGALIFSLYIIYDTQVILLIHKLHPISCVFQISCSLSNMWSNISSLWWEENTNTVSGSWRHINHKIKSHMTLKTNCFPLDFRWDPLSQWHSNLCYILILVLSAPRSTSLPPSTSTLTSSTSSCTSSWLSGSVAVTRSLPAMTPLRS